MELVPGDVHCVTRAASRRFPDNGGESKPPVYFVRQVGLPSHKLVSTLTAALERHHNFRTKSLHACGDQHAVSRLFHKKQMGS